MNIVEVVAEMCSFRAALRLAMVFYAAAVTSSFAAKPAPFIDPLDSSAINDVTPSVQPLIGIANTGDHLVAVGSRGMIIVSDKSGHKWHQANVPVQSDLTDVYFVDAMNGWASGQDGVILRSIDGGENWIKLADGITLGPKFENYYSSAANPSANQSPVSSSSLSADLQEINANFQPGPILPWLGVWFANAETGYVVGAFGDIARTDDGGKSWTPWLDHIGNPSFYDLDAIREVGNNIFIVGEQGGVYVYDPSKNGFINRSTAYTGSLFGLCGDDKTLLVFGMRGHIFRSTDLGKTWTAAVNSLTSAIMNGVELPNGSFVLVTVDGNILLSSDGGKSFKTLPEVQDTPLSSVTAKDNELVMTSLGGIRRIQQP